MECVNHELRADKEYSTNCPLEGDIHAPLLGLIAMRAKEDDERKPPLYGVGIFERCIGKFYCYICFKVFKGIQPGLY